MNISGVISVENATAQKRDALAITKTKSVSINATKKSELLCIEVLL